MYCVVYTTKGTNNILLLFYYLKSNCKQSGLLPRNILYFRLSIMLIFLSILTIVSQILIYVLETDNSLLSNLLSLLSIIRYSYLFLTFLIAIWIIYLTYIALLSLYQRLYEKALKVKRLLFQPFKNLLPIKNKNTKGTNSPSPQEDGLNLNRILNYILYGVIFIFIKGIIESPIHCDDGDDDDSTTTSNKNSQSTAGKEQTETTSTTSIPNTTNNTESLNNRLGKDTTAIATEVGKAVAAAANKAIEKAGEEMTSAMGSAVSQAIGQTGLAGAIVGGMGVGASISAGQPLPVRVVTSTTLGIISGGTHVAYSGLNRGLAAAQGSRNTGSDSTPPSPGVEPTDYPFHSVNESIPLENILDNPVQDWLVGMVSLAFGNCILTLLLLFTFISKVLFSLNYELKFLDRIFPKHVSDRLRSVLLKTLKFFSGIRTFNYIMLLLVLIFSSFFLLYGLTLFYMNIEQLAELYLKIVKKV